MIWNILSFINEPTETKKVFTNTVLVELKQVFLKKIVNICLSQGARFVCTELDGHPCLNCYYYGIGEESGTCANHFADLPDVWMNYQQYQKRTGYVNETWEQFDARTTAERQEYQDRQNAYLERVNQELNQYYRQESINSFLQFIQHPEQYRRGFMYRILPIIRAELHQELATRFA